MLLGAIATIIIQCVAHNSFFIHNKICDRPHYDSQNDSSVSAFFTNGTVSNYQSIYFSNCLSIYLLSRAKES